MNSLSMILADFINDDEINCSVFPEDVFNLSSSDSASDEAISDTQIERVAEFNRAAVDKYHVVALPSVVQGIAGVFIAKLNVELSDNDRTVFAMFLEPVVAQNAVEKLHAQALVTLLEKL